MSIVPTSDNQIVVFAVADPSGVVLSYLVQLEPHEPAEIVAGDEAEAISIYCSTLPPDEPLDPLDPFFDVEVNSGATRSVERLYYNRQPFDDLLQVGS